MTSKSEIASIMLEAAELLKEDNEEVMNESGIGKNGKESKKYGHEAARQYAKGREYKNNGNISDAVFAHTEGLKRKWHGKDAAYNNGMSINISNLNNELERTTDKVFKKMTNANCFAQDSKIQPKNKFDKKGARLREADIERRREKAKKYFDKKDNSLSEAVDVLYEKASLCESAEDTMYYINLALSLTESMSESDEITIGLNESIEELLALNDCLNKCGYSLNESADGQNIFKKFIDKALEIIDSIISWIKEKTRKSGVCMITRECSVLPYVFASMPTEILHAKALLLKTSRSDEEIKRISDEMTNFNRPSNMKLRKGQTVNIDKVYKLMDSLKTNLKQLKRVTIEPNIKTISDTYRRFIVDLISDTKAVISSVDSVKGYDDNIKHDGGIEKSARQARNLDNE